MAETPTTLQAILAVVPRRRRVVIGRAPMARPDGLDTALGCGARGRAVHEERQK